MSSFFMLCIAFSTAYAITDIAEKVLWATRPGKRIVDSQKKK